LNSAFLTNYTLEFAEKKGNDFTILSKNRFGYLRITANTNSGVPILGRAILTDLRESDFGKCGKFSK
jgi:hypothetical protein